MTRQDAAVLVPLFRDAEGALRLVLVRRAEGGIHGGQLAFPGGKPEAVDASMEETAIREACEETGLTSEAIEVLAALPVLETSTSGFRIAPFLARIRRPDRWIPQANEIVEILEVRVDDLMRPEAHDESIESFPTWPGPRRIAFYRIGPHRLWGASYRIFHPLLPRIVAGEWEL
jgi:8-oxo-dGTP pyrophosphatase MutT (NUDIX family)